MKKEEMNFFEWQERFNSEEACKAYLYKEKWSNGFQCSQCGHDHAHYLPSRDLYQCRGCHKQHSITADTVFHSTKLPLKKWLWAIYWIASDKGGISALRLMKLLGVSWPTARLMLTKLRQTMGDRDSIYRLSDMIELDDAFVGGKKKASEVAVLQEKSPSSLRMRATAHEQAILPLRLLSEFMLKPSTNFQNGNVCKSKLL